MTIFCSVLVISFTVMRTIKLVNKIEPFFSSTIEVYDGQFDLWALDFMFAIQKLDPRIGTIEAYHATWPKGQKEKVKRPIKLVDCEELLEGGEYEG